MITVSSNNLKNTNGNLIFLTLAVIYELEIYSSLLWGPCNLLVDADRHRFIHRHNIFFLTSTMLFFHNIKKSAYYGRLLAVGKKIKKGDSNSLYKRENACADCSYPEHFVANALHFALLIIQNLVIVHFFSTFVKAHYIQHHIYQLIKK